MIRLASTAFIPLAENCSPLQSQKDAKGEFFRLVAEQGHYAGRTKPSATRQGIYALTPGGHLLASVNTRAADQMLAMMHKALAAWESLDAAERLSEGKIPIGPYEPDPQFSVRRPDDGLILKVYSRDLPREGGGPADDWRRTAVNFNHAWFTADEMRQFIPSSDEVGAVHTLPQPIVRRFALYHMIDNVRGETPMWRPSDLQSAELRTEVIDKDEEKIVLWLSGSIRCSGSGIWPLRPFEEPQQVERGVEMSLGGTLRWNRKTQTFDRFDVVAAGTRWGGTEHNLRWDDLDPAPLGIAFELAGVGAQDRIPPQGVYGGYFG